MFPRWAAGWMLGVSLPALPALAGAADAVFSPSASIRPPLRALHRRHASCPVRQLTLAEAIT